jgi:D-alanyl-D-alanine carboxypeptidase/D-alanyl-D-alanine-endopeptidase (penicillin-binding protein 4)
MSLRGRIAAAGGIVALLAPVAAHASATSDNSPSAARELARAMQTSQVRPAESAAVALDLATGRTLFSQNADVALEPASNEKLMVTYGALTELGPGFRFHTDVLGEGRQVGSVWQGRLVLKGYGDPTLGSDDLQRLAKKLYDLGIRMVTGHVAGDASWFDSRWMARGWLPGDYGFESAPLSALVVNRGIREGHLVSNPPLAAAALFDRMLRAQGIATRDAVVGTAHAGATPLVSVHSHKLSLLLQLMNTDSDNFTAEMLLKAIGAEAAGVGSTATGAAVVRPQLAAAGVPLAGARIVDGSGLSQLDRVTARELSTLLLLFWKVPELHAIVKDSLAVAGETGTLQYRLLGKQTRGIVRAKTGTTHVASALSGYVGSRYAFVLVQNGHPVDWDAAHAAQDRFVESLASLSARAALAVRSR